MAERRRALLTAALGFLQLRQQPSEVAPLRQWLDSWRGLGDIVRGLNAQGLDLELRQFPRDWRANLYPTRHRTFHRGCVSVGADAVAGGAAGWVASSLAPGSGVSVVAHVIRQFQASHELVTLEKLITLPALPTMGARLDLRSRGVEAPLEVVSITLRAESDGTPHLDIFLAYEPLANGELARAAGWRDSAHA